MLAQICALEHEPVLGELLAVGIEMAAFSSSDARPGRPSLVAQCAQQQVNSAAAGQLDTVYPTVKALGLTSLRQCQGIPAAAQHALGCVTIYKPPAGSSFPCHTQNVQERVHATPGLGSEPRMYSAEHSHKP